MAQNLKQYLAGRSCQAFRPVPHYFANGDFVSYYFREDRCYAQRVDDLLTIYLAIGSGDLVGCKIKGVRHILRTAGDFGVKVDDGDVELGLFFFVGAIQAKSESQRVRYEELGRIAKHATVARKELQSA